MLYIGMSLSSDVTFSADDIRSRMRTSDFIMSNQASIIDAANKKIKKLKEEKAKLRKVVNIVLFYTRPKLNRFSSRTRGITKGLVSPHSNKDKMTSDIIQNFEIVHDDLVVFDNDENSFLPCEMPTP